MKINRRARRFHDPWGVRFDGEGKSVISGVYMVGSEMPMVINHSDKVDKTRFHEADEARYVLGSKSVEKTR